MFFQQMQTPEDITARELQVNDLPYAGLLSSQSIMYSYDKNRSDQFSVFLGIVGPVAGAERAQTNIHSIVGADEPMGWTHQLRNEPVFRLEARRVTKLKQNYSGKLKYDVLGLGTVGFGNLRSSVQAGLAVRWGTNLEFSHATFSLQPDRQVNGLSLSSRKDFYVYAGFDTSYVLNDILVDGNTFTDSHSIPLEHLQTDASFGIVWKIKRLAYVFEISSLHSRTTLTSERDGFGALSVTWAYR